MNLSINNFNIRSSYQQLRRCLNIQRSNLNYKKTTVFPIMRPPNNIQITSLFHSRELAVSSNFRSHPIGGSVVHKIYTSFNSTYRWNA